MDWLPVTEAALALASAVVALAWRLGTEWLLRSRVSRVEGVVARAAGQVIEEMRRNPALQLAAGAALDRAAQYVADSVPDTLRKLGVDRDQVARMVRGELGKLLAAEPRPVTVRLPASAADLVARS